MRTLEEDDFDSRTTLPRVPRPLLLELSDDDFRRGFVGAPPVVEPGMRARVSTARVSKAPLAKKRVWPLVVFIALAAASAGIALGAPPNWKENAAAKFAGSVTITEAALARPKPAEEPAPPPPPAAPATVKPMSVAASAPQVAFKPQAAAMMPKVAPKIVPKVAAPVEPKSAVEDDPYEAVPTPSKAQAPASDEVEAPKAAPAKTAEAAPPADPPAD